MYCGNHTIITVVMLGPLQCRDKFIHHIIDVDKVHHHAGIVDLYGNTISDVIAESGYGTVIVGTTPFAEHVRETVDQYLSSGLPGVIEHQLLPCPFRFPIRVIQSRLGRRRDHHRTGVAVLLEGIQQGGGKTEIAFHELPGILGTVDPRQVEHEVRLSAIFIQKSRICV